MHEADAFTAPILGHAAWNVRQGYGSFLDLQFGSPHLDQFEYRSRDGRLHRSVCAKGEWHLWIYCCHWRILDGADQRAWSEDDRPRIDRAAAFLDGQKLIAVELEPGDGRSAFRFDLGGTLLTWPYGGDPEEDQWTIYSSDNILSWHATVRPRSSPARGRRRRTAAGAPPPIGKARTGD